MAASVHLGIPGQEQLPHTVRELKLPSRPNLSLGIMATPASPQVYPNVGERKARVALTLGNRTGTSGSGTLKVQAQGYNTGDVRHADSTTSVTWNATGGSAEITLSLRPGAQLWDEFTPGPLPPFPAVPRCRLF